MIAERELPDGRVLTVEPLLFDRARLTLSDRGSAFVDDQW